MKSIFDKGTRDELITRINTLNDNSKSQWGKMNVNQMLQHCTLWDDMILGKKKYKRMLIGRLIGGMLLKNVLKDEKPLKRNTPTLPDLVIKETNGSIVSARTKWIARLEEYAHFSNPAFVHVFFGKMTEEQVGYFVYKHIDHHLRQFNS